MLLVQKIYNSGVKNNNIKSKCRIFVLSVYKLSETVYIPLIGLYLMLIHVHIHSLPSIVQDISVQNNKDFSIISDSSYDKVLNKLIMIILFHLVVWPISTLVNGKYVIF